MLLAVTLAVISLIQALLHAQALTTRLIQQAQPQARQLANTAGSIFGEQAKSALRSVAGDLRLKTYTFPWEAADFVAWIDGIYTWNGTDFTTITEPVHVTGDIADEVRGRLLLRFPLPATLAPTQRVEIVHQHGRTTEIVLACLVVPGAGGDNVIIAGRIHLERLKADLADPLLAIADGLEIVPTREASGAWSHPMSGALSFWTIQPTDAFLQEQQDTILYQSLGYIGLTVLSLLTLLAALWFMLRVLRREVALAEMKSNFVADVSHELKTPLALIHLFGETLQEGRVRDEEKKQEYYNIITRESGRLTNLINNILDFSRIDAGRKEYSLKRTELASLAREMYEAYRHELDHDGFEHHLNLEPNLPVVMADRDAIGQAILNLIGNAIKYSTEEKYILIDLRQETRRGRHGVLISVHDCGIGIRPEDRAHLFDGFFRSSDRRVRDKRGTGIGLALVKRIVDAHNGFLIVESRLVKGTTFRIFLPAAPPEEAVTQAPAAEPEQTS